MEKWHKFPQETPNTVYEENSEFLDAWFITSDQYGNLSLKQWNEYHNHFMGKGRAAYIANNVFFWMRVTPPPMADDYVELDALERKRRKIEEKIKAMKEKIQKGESAE